MINAYDVTKTYRPITMYTMYRKYSTVYYPDQQMKNIYIYINNILYNVGTLTIEVGECLLLFGAESFIFQFAIQKVKIKIYTS